MNKTSSIVTSMQKMGCTQGASFVGETIRIGIPKNIHETCLSSLCLPVLLHFTTRDMTKKNVLRSLTPGESDTTGGGRCRGKHVRPPLELERPAVDFKVVLLCHGIHSN